MAKRKAKRKTDKENATPNQKKIRIGGKGGGVKKDQKAISSKAKSKEAAVSTNPSVYIVKHSSHVVTCSRVKLDDALASGSTKGWSDARIKAFAKRETNPNSYYYRFNDPGEQQHSGFWTPEEKKIFLKRLKELGGADGQWGLFSMGTPGRVGYQCSNYYRKLIEHKELVDPNYVLDENGKAHFLHKRGNKGARAKKRQKSMKNIINQRSSSISEAAQQALEAWKKNEVFAFKKKPRVVCTVLKAIKGTHLFTAAKVNGQKFSVGDFVWIDTPTVDEDLKKDEDRKQEEPSEDRRQEEPYVIQVTRIWKEPKQSIRTTSDEQSDNEKEADKWEIYISGWRMYSKKELAVFAPCFFEEKNTSKKKKSKGKNPGDKYCENELFLSIYEQRTPAQTVLGCANVLLSRRKLPLVKDKKKSKAKKIENTTENSDKTADFSAWDKLTELRMRLSAQYFYRYAVDISVGWIALCISTKKEQTKSKSKVNKKNKTKGNKNISNDTKKVTNFIRLSRAQLLNRRDELVKKQRRNANAAAWKAHKEIQKKIENEAKAAAAARMKANEEKMNEPVAPSKYELERMRRIRENDAFLLKLGLSGGISQCMQDVVN